MYADMLSDQFSNCLAAMLTNGSSVIQPTTFVNDALNPVGSLPNTVVYKDADIICPVPARWSSGSSFRRFHQHNSCTFLFRFKVGFSSVFEGIFVALHLMPSSLAITVPP